MIRWSEVWSLVPAFAGETDDSTTDDVGRSARSMWDTFVEALDGQLVIIPNRDVYKNAIRVQTASSSLPVGVSHRGRVRE